MNLSSSSVKPHHSSRSIVLLQPFKSIDVNSAFAGSTSGIVSWSQIIRHPLRGHFSQEIFPLIATRTSQPAENQSINGRRKSKKERREWARRFRWGDILFDLDFDNITRRDNRVYRSTRIVCLPERIGLGAFLGGVHDRDAYRTVLHPSCTRMHHTGPIDRKGIHAPRLIGLVYCEGNALVRCLFVCCLQRSHHRYRKTMLWTISFFRVRPSSGAGCIRVNPSLFAVFVHWSSFVLATGLRWMHYGVAMFFFLLRDIPFLSQFNLHLECAFFGLHSDMISRSASIRLYVVVVVLFTLPVDWLLEIVLILAR